MCKGRPQGAAGFSTDDVQTLLELIDAHKPYGQNGWNRVCDAYNQYAVKNARPKRDVHALRQKYYRLVNTQKPTGDPNCPDTVRMAKRIDQDIEAQVHYVVLNDDVPDELPDNWRADEEAGSDVADDADAELDDDT
ncbi:hypothetical protein C8Q77DRAFT_1054865 [Trametes polyzona]|nr:hypothetical protein C8Q77DRAFT_1054865 [Trametes polyzona]